MAGFDPRDRGEVSAAKGAAGFGGGHSNTGGGFSKGMQGATARRTAYSSPSYDATLGNLARMAGTLAPGGGVISGINGMLGGNFGPGAGGYTGYGGQVSTPGFNDGPNRALGQNGPMGYGGNPAAQMFNPLQQKLVGRAGMYQGGTNAIKLAQMNGQISGGQMFMPPKQAPQAPYQAPTPQGFQPGQTLSTGGQYGISQFRPGYNFFGPGSM